MNAPAKLNLFLEIHSKRSDGFHELETLMVAITIYDTLVLAVASGDEFALDCRWAPGWEVQRRAKAGDDAPPVEKLPGGRENLAFRALDRLRDRAGVTKGARIQLNKRIPLAAGLGGASSDAAAALIAANTAWELNWPRDELAAVGASLGSDVPFFFSGSAAICRGRGELIESLDTTAPFHFVVVRPPVGLATADVYRACRPPPAPRRIDDTLAAFRAGDPERLGKCLHNRLQAAAASLSPWVSRLEHVFRQMDFLGHQLSGSGTSYFGICRHARHARRLASQLRSLEVGTVYCVATSPP